jgi:hypothetical protein
MGRHSLPRRIAKRMSARRKTYGAGTGRPRIDAPRCPCEAMTLKRARTRADREGKGLGHDPGCSFYRERVIVV